MTPQQIEALKLALEALNSYSINDFSGYEVSKHKTHIIDDAITALKEILADHAMQEVQRLGQEIEQEPVCPDCKAEVLYECVACSSNNYPPQRTEEKNI